MYFVKILEKLPPQQQAKIKCGEAHFAALQKNGIMFEAPVASYERFDDLVNNKIN